MKDPDGQFGWRDSDAALVDSLRSLGPCAPHVDWEAIHAARCGSLEESFGATKGVEKKSQFGWNSMVWCSGVACGAALAVMVMQWVGISDLQSEARRIERATTGWDRTLDNQSVAISNERDLEKPSRGDVHTGQIASWLTVRSDRTGAIFAGLERLDPLEIPNFGSKEDTSEPMEFRSTVFGELDKFQTPVGRLELLEQLLSDIH